MIDSYPSHLTIEIDRVRLRKFLCMRSLIAWATVFTLFGGLFGFVAFAKAMEAAENSGLSGGAAAICGALALMKSIGISSVLALLAFFIFSFRSDTRTARNLEVTIEGSFLRVRQFAHSMTDRKLHFRSIVDYTTYQDSLMRRCGIHSLQMTTIGGGPTSTVMIPGVKDCLKVRDMLSEIDHLRENE